MMLHVLVCDSLVAPAGSASRRQKSWDNPKATADVKELLDGAPDALTRARSLAAFGKESGAWLEALPISSLGLCIDDNTVIIAMGFKLRAPLCRPHHCQFCGSDVGCEGIHGLSCHTSIGHHHHHSEVNNIIYRSLTQQRFHDVWNHRA